MSTNNTTMDQKIQRELDVLKWQNQDVLEAFNELKKTLRQVLDIKSPCSIELTGSRAFGLSYMESNVNFAFIAPDSKSVDALRDRFVSEIKAGTLFKGHTFPVGLSAITKTGPDINNAWIAIDVDHFGGDQYIRQLSISFRTKEQHSSITQHINRQMPLLFPTDKHKWSYITRIGSYKRALEILKNTVQLCTTKTEETAATAALDACIDVYFNHAKSWLKLPGTSSQTTNTSKDH